MDELVTLRKDLNERYSRMLSLHDFGEDDLEKLIDTTVSVVGAGGLGSPALRLLSAIGFGRIRIIDHDIVELSNLQRQTIYNTDDLGIPKAEAAAENLSRMNPNVEFEPVCVSLDAENAIDILKGSDMILDGLDSIHSRRPVNTASQTLNIPYIYAGAVEYYSNISTFIPKQTGCLHCLVGDLIDNPDRTCAAVGVSPSLLSMVAAIETREAVLLGIGRKPNLAGMLMHVDIASLGFDKFQISKAEDCPICSVQRSEPPSKSAEEIVSQLCSGHFRISP
ncbi:MAG: HesA/MoeB/ThiF family protein, partial [Candidatus Thorarchaeota archaeon]